MLLPIQTPTSIAATMLIAAGQRLVADPGTGFGST
jgi:hypothetical protein